MKKLFVFLISFAPFCLSAQTAKLHIDLTNATPTAGCLAQLPILTLKYDLLKKGGFKITLNPQQSGSHELAINQPQFVNLTAYSADSEDGKWFLYRLYVRPGDDITIKADFIKQDYGIAVSGKGSQNNQPLLARMEDFDTDKFNGDTLPTRILDAIAQQQAHYTTALNTYITNHQPSPDFIKAWKQHLNYYAVEKYFRFQENNKYAIREAYSRNYGAWQKPQDSLFARVKLNNPDAMISISYTSLLRDFLIRKKEQLWNEHNNHPEAFFKEWYQTDPIEGEKLYAADMENLLQEKIINKYFTGKPAEYLYAILLETAMKDASPNNMLSIFNHLKQQNPGSSYINWFKPAITAVVEKDKRKLNGKMIFAEADGRKINSFAEMLHLTKGKTVLLDMWGTWCGPCRADMDKNGPAVKAYFEGKGLNYLYVANLDTQNEKEWKRLIAYFNLTGTHILANEKLTKDIMDKTGGTGYPTYVIIKKNGTHELLGPGYSVTNKAWIKKVEDALLVR